MFIGYDEKTKGFKLLDPINKKVMISRDVKVNEPREWDYKNSSEVIVERGESSTTSTTSSEIELARSPQITDDEEEPRQSII
jgi:hypothetical protein